MPDTNENELEPTWPVAEGAASDAALSDEAVQPEAGVEPVSGTVPEPEPETQAAPDAEPESVPVTEPAPEAEPESVPVTDPDVASTAEPEAAPEFFAASADATETAVLDPIAAGDTQVLPPVPLEPESNAPASDAPASPEFDALVGGAAATSQATYGDDAADDATASDSGPNRNALGVWAVVTGALLLFPIALVLGHLGLRANRQGEANNKRVALAGVILGYVGLVVALVGTAIALFVVSPNVSAQNADNAAKADVINVGSAVATQSVPGGELPTVAGDADGYLVGDTTVPAELETPGVPSLEGESTSDWCLVLAYEGGNDAAVAFSATEGLVSGATCS